MMKRFIFAGVSVLAIALALAIWVVSSQKAYTSDITTFTGQLAQAHAAQREDFDGLTANATNADVATLMRRSEERLKKILADAPDVPLILQAPFLATDTKEQAEELRVAALDLERSLRATHQYIAYESQVSAVVREVTRQEYVSLAGQEALAAKWSSGIKKLETNIPLTDRQEVEGFVAQFKNMQPTIEAMVGATKRGDFTGYQQQRSLFSNQLKELQAASRKFTEIARTHDKAVSKAYERLGELVK